MAGFIIMVAIIVIVFNFAKGITSKTGSSAPPHSHQQQALHEQQIFMDGQNQLFVDQMNREQNQRDIEESMRESERAAMNSANEAMHAVDHNFPTNQF